MPLCNKNMTPLQRRSMRRMVSVLLLTVLTNITNPRLPNVFFDLFPGLLRFLSSHQNAHNGLSSVLVVGSLSAVSLVPVLLGVWVAANYLKAEPDDFIRALVIRALLWGFAVTMAGDAIMGVLMTYYSSPFPISLLNADLFFPATGIAFRLLLRSYR
jgi:hypothetical protein